MRPNMTEDYRDDQFRIHRALSGDYRGEFETIGACLLGEGQFDDIASLLQPKHFGWEPCQAAFEAMLRLRVEGRPLSIERVAEMVEGRCHAEQLEDMLRSMPWSLAQDAQVYARRVLDGWRRRMFDQAAYDAAQALGKPLADSEEILHQHIKQIEATLDDGVTTEGSGRIDDQLLQEAEAGPTERIPSGLCDLDVYLDGGFMPGPLIVIGARPSVGKSALAGGLALGATLAGYPTLMLSFEMAEAEVTKRFRGQFAAKPDDTDKLNELAALPLYVRKSGDWSIDRVESEARRYVRRHKLRVLIVDFLSLVVPRDRRLPRHEQVGDISRSLKQLASRPDWW